MATKKTFLPVFTIELSKTSLFLSGNALQPLGLPNANEVVPTIHYSLLINHEQI